MVIGQKKQNNIYLDTSQFLSDIEAIYSEQISGFCIFSDIAQGLFVIFH